MPGIWNQLMSNTPGVGQRPAAQAPRPAYAPNVASDPGHDTFVGGLLGQNRHHTNPGSFAMPGFEQTQSAYAAAIQQQQHNAATGGENYHPMMWSAMQGAAPTINQDAANHWRNQQGQLSQMLLNQASGTGGPSAAQAQLQAGTDANVRNAMAMGQSMGGNNMAAHRSILENQALAQQQGVNQAAQLRAQEAQSAQGMLGNVLQGARGQDLGVAGEQANMFQRQDQMNQQAGQGWAQMAQNQTQMGNQAALGYAGLLNQNSAVQLQAQIEQQRIAAAAKAGASGNAAALTGGVLNSIGAGIFNNTGPGQGMARGGMVPGYATGGDARANDVVPAMLSPGEIVLPRSVVNDEDAERKAAEFVRAIKARRTK